jgi:hypothetical protein
MGLKVQTAYKRFCSILIISLFFSLMAHSQTTKETVIDSLPHFKKVLTPNEMREDLQLFLDIRKKTNSGLYRYRSEKQIDSIYNWAFESVKQPIRIVDFYKIILQLTDFEGSVHNYTELDAGWIDFLKHQKAFFPYPLTYINGQIIFDFHTEKIPAGSRILSINGIKDVDLMQSFYKYFPADGYTVTEKLSASVDKSFGIYYLLEYGLTDKYQVEYIPSKTKSRKKTTFSAVTLAHQEENQKKKV